MELCGFIIWVDHNFHEESISGEFISSWNENNYGKDLWSLSQIWVFDQIFNSSWSHGIPIEKFVGLNNAEMSLGY